MSIKPILMSTEMVRAILDGRKTVTRRVVKHQDAFLDGAKTFEWNEEDAVFDAYCENDTDRWIYAVPPPYRPGDILYVRETWFQFKHGGYAYRADSNDVSEMMREDLGYKWRSSIHMPREAARIWLRVTDVRVERLREITCNGAKAEGVGRLFIDEIRYGDKEYGCMGTDKGEDYGLAREQFAHLWDSPIKPKDHDRYGWAANPWVWVISFERCEKPEEG